MSKMCNCSKRILKNVKKIGKKQKEIMQSEEEDGVDDESSHMKQADGHKVC